MILSDDDGNEHHIPDSGLYLAPTWAVSVVMALFVVLSLVVQNILQCLTRWIMKHRQKPLYECLEKLKKELMSLGFMSLFVSSVAILFSRICTDSSFYSRKFTLCKHNAKLFRPTEMLGFSYDYRCGKGRKPVISVAEIHEVHRFLFVMAITHIFYSCMTVILAVWKVYSWKKWEEEIHSRNCRISELAKSISTEQKLLFGLYKMSKPTSARRLLLWLVCFARQFKQSVSRADYSTVRLGFIMEHNLPNDYNFYKYIDRCVETDFSRILEISPALWGFAILFVLLEVDGLNFYFWIAFIPILVVLVLGTRLQYLMATIAFRNLNIAEESANMESHIRHQKHGCLLYLLHFILFQNSFELATFLGSWWWHLEDHTCLIKSQTCIRIIFGLLAQILCSYSTLPTYALTSQVGCSSPRKILSKKVLECIDNWHMSAKNKLKEDRCDLECQAK